jgi:signal peptidase I
VGWFIAFAVINWVIAINPDSALSQRVLRLSFGGEYAWVWKDGGQLTSRSIPSLSMAPTLLPGDRVLCMKHSRAPKVGDIWVFNHLHSDRVMVKRIIAMAGDTVQMKGGLLVINGKQVGRTFIQSVTYFEELRPDRADEYAERLPGDTRTHLIHEFSDTDNVDETPVFKVPAGHVFMMGDNRDNSEDSRAPSGHRDLAAKHPEFWPYRAPGLPRDPRDDAIGFVPIENLIARAAMVYLSLHGCQRPKDSNENVECLQPNIDARL